MASTEVIPTCSRWLRRWRSDSRRFNGLTSGAAVVLMLASAPIGTTSAYSTAALGVPTAAVGEDSRYLFVWAGDRARRTGDLLAVVDVDPSSPTYATVVATLPVGAIATVPHHTEHEMPEGGELWANGFSAGRVFRFDLRNPTAPRLTGEIADAKPYAYPHSFARLANGHVLATYQYQLKDTASNARAAMHEHGGDAVPTSTPPPAPHGTTGGLAEFDATGHLLRVVSAGTASDSAIRPYSLTVLPAIDRVVTTSNDMFAAVKSHTVQVWRLSDLRLMASVALPAGPRGDEQWNPAEPRVLDDGRTVIVSTSECGLYRLTGLDGDRPSAQWVYSGTYDPNLCLGGCALTVVAGRFLLQANASARAIVSFDVSDPAKPREVSRLFIGDTALPHWISLEPSGHRVVITGNGDLRGRVMLARFNQQTGSLALDSAFRSPGSARPGIDLSVLRRPGGDTVVAVPHGAVFSRP